MENYKDVGHWAMELKLSSSSSLAAVSKAVLGKTLDKAAYIRRGLWHRSPLSKTQISYAAADAAVGRAIYGELDKLSADVLVVDAEVGKACVFVTLHPVS